LAYDAEQMAASSRFSNIMTSRTKFVVMTLALAAGALLWHCRLALEPDSWIAKRLYAKVANAHGVESVRSLLAREYAVGGTSSGVPWEGHETGEGSSVDLLVGEYQGVPFRVAVEALVVLDRTGRVTRVLVRRTRLGI
jgi:hypothetical protein